MSAPPKPSKIFVATLIPREGQVGINLRHAMIHIHHCHFKTKKTLLFSHHCQFKTKKTLLFFYHGNCVSCKKDCKRNLGFSLLHIHINHSSTSTSLPFYINLLFVQYFLISKESSENIQFYLGNHLFRSVPAQHHEPLCPTGHCDH